MKKGIAFFYIFLLILATFLCSCKVSVEDKNLMRKPDVDLSDKQVTIIIQKINSDTDYINIYRKSTTTRDAAEERIGIIYPENNDDMTYRFIDTLVYEDETYSYKVRYHDNSGYRYSEWSNEIEIENINYAYAPDKKLAYQTPDNTRFLYNDTNYTLSISGTITNPEISNFTNDYQPMLIVSSEEATQVFKIRPQALTNGEIITLRDRLPASFMDKTITIKGIVAQQTEYYNPDETDDNKKKVKLIRWTPPTSIKIAGRSENTLFIPSSAASAGTDYSLNIHF